MTYIDAHCHFYSFNKEEVDKISSLTNFIIVAVSDDLNSTIKTLNSANKIGIIVPCVGLHPWNVKSEDSLVEVDKITEKIENAQCIGEVGLDQRFNKENYNLQKEVFYKFVEIAKKSNKPINIHALDAWREAFEIVKSYNIKKAIFHWYSGPTDLLKHFEKEGYFITINPSVTFQRKHGRVLKEAPLKILLTESDGPYNYRGKILHPIDVKNLVRYIAEVKKLKEEEVIKAILTNYNSIFH